MTKWLTISIFMAIFLLEISVKMLQLYRKTPTSTVNVKNDFPKHPSFLTTVILCMLHFYMSGISNLKLIPNDKQEKLFIVISIYSQRFYKYIFFLFLSVADNWPAYWTRFLCLFKSPILHSIQNFFLKSLVYCKMAMVFMYGNYLTTQGSTAGSFTVFAF